MLPFQISALRWGRVSHLPGYASPRKTAISKVTCHAGSCSIGQNDAGTNPLDWHKTGTTRSVFVPGLNQANEDIGASAGTPKTMSLNTFRRQDHAWYGPRQSRRGRIQSLVRTPPAPLRLTRVKPVFATRKLRDPLQNWRPRGHSA